ncbi:hypothetical protein Y1Q_0022987 [Alligator mississippiensis]|uniref:Uncharacterized protein n=1 Tax=Alligator mississippiensis TaxID=8496 RepID=A0A151P756_ALLMI|nr:hypothetical protein Y1Q_0022987 [Alligator mississippiensis]
MKCGCLDFGACSELAQVEDVSFKTVLDAHTKVIILEGVRQHSREYHVKEGMLDIMLPPVLASLVGSEAVGLEVQEGDGSPGDGILEPIISTPAEVWTFSALLLSRSFPSMESAFWINLYCPTMYFSKAPRVDVEDVGEEGCLVLDPEWKEDAYKGVETLVGEQGQD